MSMSPPLALSLRRMAPALLVLALAGCAQTGAPAVDSARQNSTLEDAQRQAQGRNAARAPSQVQFGFGQDAADARPATASGGNAAAADSASDTALPAQATLRELSEPKTFLGTVPCPANACQAARISLTLAPSGHWRSRTVVLAPNQGQSAEQGCWEAAGVQPARILLLLDDRAVRATLEFVNDNVLRVHDIHGAKPVLEYRLTRQQDIDPIDELKGQPLPACKAPQ